MEHQELLRHTRSSTALRSVLERPSIRPSDMWMKRSDVQPKPKQVAKGHDVERQSFLSDEDDRRRRDLRTVLATAIVMAPMFNVARPDYEDDLALAFPEYNLG